MNECTYVCMYVNTFEDSGGVRDTRCGAEGDAGLGEATRLLLHVRSG